MDYSRKSTTQYMETEIKEFNPDHFLKAASDLGIPNSFKEHLPTFLKNVETAIVKLIASKKYSGMMITYRNFYRYYESTTIMTYILSLNTGWIRLIRKKAEEGPQTPGLKNLLVLSSYQNKYLELTGTKRKIPMSKLPLLLNHWSPTIEMFARAKLQGLI
jgi:hypothetical protein